MNNSNQNIVVLKDYQKPWFIIIMLIVFFPVGLFFMWKYSTWNNTIKGIITGVFVFLFIFFLFSDSKPVEIPYVINKNYSDAKKILEDKGFTNIKILDQSGHPIIESSLSSDNYVISQKPKPSDKVSVYTKIELIIKDAGKEKESIARREKEETAKQEKIKQEAINKTFESFVNKDLKTASSKAKKLKYKVYIFNNKNVSMDKTISKKDYSNWIVIKVKNVDSKNKTVSFVVNSKKAIKLEKQRKKLESKLSETEAYYYMEQYGKQVYPYGFNLHFILGQHSAYVKNSSTWVVKSECSITNGFGATRRVMCEAKVKIKGSKIRVFGFKEY